MTPEKIFETIEWLYNNPLSIFIILSGVFGYFSYEQLKDKEELMHVYSNQAAELEGLRVEIQKMNEIIKLKVEIAERKCKDQH